MKRSLLFGVALTVLGVACGGGAKDPARSDGSVAAAELSTTTTTAAPTTTSTTPKRATLTAAQLGSALLTVEDLPSGYALSPPDEETDDAEDDLCQTSNPGKKVPPTTEQEVSFQKGSFGPFLGQGIMLFADEDRAQKYMAEFRRIVDSCSSYEEIDEDGTKSKVTVSRMSFDKVGDDTLAIKLAMEAEMPVSGDIVFARRGEVIFGITNMALGSADSSETVKVMAKADEKLRRIL